MSCLGSRVGYSAVYHTITGTLEVAAHRLDETAAAAAIGMATELWQHLRDHTIPAPVFPADSAVWNRLHPISTAGTVDLPADLVAALIEARSETKRATSREEILEAQVKELLGDCDSGLVDGAPAVLWRTITSRRVDLKTLEVDAPDLVEGTGWINRTPVHSYRTNQTSASSNRKENIMTIKVSRPAPLDRFDKAEHLGHNLAFVGPRGEVLDTSFGEADAARCVGVICATCVRGWTDVIVFGTAIVPRICNGDPVSAGVLVQGKPSPAGSRPGCSTTSTTPR